MSATDIPISTKTSAALEREAERRGTTVKTLLGEIIRREAEALDAVGRLRGMGRAYRVVREVDGPVVTSIETMLVGRGLLKAPGEK